MFWKYSVGNFVGLNFFILFMWQEYSWYACFYISNEINNNAIIIINLLLLKVVSIIYILRFWLRSDIFYKILCFILVPVPVSPWSTVSDMATICLPTLLKEILSLVWSHIWFCCQAFFLTTWNSYFEMKIKFHDIISSIKQMVQCILKTIWWLKS